MFFRYLLLLLFCYYMLLLGVVFAASPKDKPRAKRASVVSNPPLPSKPSVDELVKELAKKHLLKMILDKQNDLQKAKESVQILQKDSCTNIKSVGKPVTHNTRQIAQGAWMKDPLRIMGEKTIFAMESYAGRNVLEEFDNMDMFKAGITRKTYKLPYFWDGTGAVVYGPYLYYNSANTNKIVKYNLRTQRVEVQMVVGAYQPRRNYYAWNGYSGMDLAVDEQGLWLLWGSTDNAYRLHASKIDVYKNVIIQTWNLASEKMNTMGNAFVACGVIYCIDSYNNKPTTINFAYDTKTAKQWNPNIQFTNQYGYISMVDYNPREKVLYAWDNKRLVTYPITFEEQ